MNEPSDNHTDIHLTQHKRAKLLKGLSILIGVLSVGLELRANGLVIHDSPGAIFYGILLYLGFWGLFVAVLTFFISSWGSKSLNRFLCLMGISTLIGLVPLSLLCLVT